MNKQSNTDWKKRGVIALWSSLLLIFFFTVGFTSHRMKTMPCAGVEVNIIDSTGHSFVEPSDIRELIADKFGEIEGAPSGSINMALLEKIILNNPFVASARVFSTIEGKLHVEVVQREPVVRVINIRDESFYIDDKGVFMPLSEKYTARVPVVNGYLFNREAEKKVRFYTSQELADTSVRVSRIDQVFHVANFIHRDEFWKAQVEQIYIRVNGDIELIPRLGNHTIILGDDRRLEEKFNKLNLFYTEGLSKTGWNKYTTINLKYNDQLVCTKK